MGRLAHPAQKETPDLMDRKEARVNPGRTVAQEERGTAETLEIRVNLAVEGCLEKRAKLETRAMLVRSGPLETRVA